MSRRSPCALAGIVAIAMSVSPGVASGVSNSRFADTYQNLPPIPNGKARVIFFREAHVVGMGAQARIKINGITIIVDLENNKAVPIDVDSGNLDIGIDMWIEPGRAAIPLAAEAGKEYFIELGGSAESPTANMAGAVPYVLGSLRRVLEHPVCGGGWCAQIEDREAAWPHIADTDLQQLIEADAKD